MQYPYGSLGAPAPGVGVIYYPPAPGSEAAAAAAAGADQDPNSVGDEEESIARCHLHTKPQLSCKFCRKYKSYVQQMGVLQQRQLAQEDEVQRRNMVQLTDTTTYNVNPLLRGNILSSEYFKSLHQLKTFQEVAEEVASYAEHAEPYCAGSARAPSTLFCCLYKMFTLRLTEKQVTSLLKSSASPFVRCTGFLYLRYAHPPDMLWRWYEPYFLDDEEFTPSADKSRSVTIGEYAQSLLTEDKYFSTVLPRLPVLVKNVYGAQLMTLPQHRRRKIYNRNHVEAFVPGAKGLALSSGDWLEGEVMSFGSSGVWMRLEDGSEELIDLGLVQLFNYTSGSGDPINKTPKKKQRGRERHKTDRDQERDKDLDRKRNRSRSPDRGAKTQQQLLQEFRRKEQEKALASGKDYARRPTSYKSALSLKMTSSARHTTSPERNTTYSRPHARSALAHVQQQQQQQQQQAGSSSSSSSSSSQQQRMSSLVARYSRAGGEINDSRRRVDTETPEVMRLG